MSAARRTGRSKTIATWLALFGGTLGLHRFYLHGARDLKGWLLWVPTLVGLVGVLRMRTFGQDDQLAWVLIPFLGLTLAGTMLAAIVHGLTPQATWRARFDPSGSAFSAPPLDVLGAIVALAFGAIALMASTAFMAQRYFEYRALERAAPDQTKSQRLTP